MTWVATLRGEKGNKVGLALGELHRGENDLATTLLGLADRQKVDHEIFHVARDIAAWSSEHVARIAEVASDYGVDLEPEAHAEPGLLARAQQKTAELAGRHHDTGMLLLADLRRVHVLAAGVSLDWEVLAQTAQALKDETLLSVASDAHPQTLRQMRWANAKIKELSPQVMTTR